MYSGVFTYKMAMSSATNKIMYGIIGAIVIFYLVASTWDDASAEVNGVNTSIKGGSFIRLLPLFLAFGIGISIIKLVMGN